MRTAVVRIDVDPSAMLSVIRLSEGMATLSELAGAVGVEVVAADVAAMLGDLVAKRVLEI